MKRGVRSFGWLVLCGLCGLLAAGCGSSDSGVAPPQDGGSDGTVPAESSVDSAASDARGGEAGRDATVDAGGDASDAALDGSDATLDAGDSAADASEAGDAGVEAAADAGVDALSDTGVDSGVDSSVDSGVDSGLDSGVVDSGDAATGDATVDAGGTVYNDMTSPSFWTSFDTTTVNAAAQNFLGGAFDGRYVYLAPHQNGVVTRYDTSQVFITPTSWSTVDTAMLVSGSAWGYDGVAFDGRYLYFVPNTNTAYDGVVVRYDTQASFTAATSWATFDTAANVNASATGFAGWAFDGRYVYFVPSFNGAVNGIVVRYDTQASFSATASWGVFDTTTVVAGAEGFFGAVFDGRYVYFVPNINTAIDGLVTRYDTQASFTATASWSTFDVAGMVNPSAKGFLGGAFDGRYVYFVPYNNIAYDGIVARYDTQGTFTSMGSWSTFDAASAHASSLAFAGGGFDGRYVYFVPNAMGGTAAQIATRYDTLAPFGSASAWSVFATPSVGAQLAFFGSVFDGRYMYFVPYYGGAVARFDAKSPPSMPALPAFYGSFF